MMTKDEIRIGLLEGRTLVQEEWTHPSEIVAVDALLEEGFAAATPWVYSDNFQCGRRYVVKK